jgi:hypothetical protein
MAVRDIGDFQYHYWMAASQDGRQLLMEPGESVLHVGYYRVSQIAPKAWVLPNTTVVITDRRTAFFNTQFDKGGGWVGFGAGGMAVAATANMVSKRRAAQRSAGKVAIGQMRHEWLIAITLRRVKALVGVVDNYVDLAVATATGPRVIELWGSKATNEEFARWLVGTISTHRTELLGPEAIEQKAKLQKYQRGDHDPAPTRKPNDLAWYFPGKVDELISTVISRQGNTFQAPE